MSVLRQALFAAVLVTAGSVASAAGDLLVVGTGDGLEVLRAVGAAYTADYSDTSVFVPPSVHSSGGIAAVRSGTAVLGRIARPLTLEERAEGIVEIPVFRLPSVVIINPAANVRSLSAEQAARIFPTAARSSPASSCRRSTAATSPIRTIRAPSRSR